MGVHMSEAIHVLVLEAVLAAVLDRLSQVAAVPRTADFLMNCASEVRNLKFRVKKVVPHKEAVVPYIEAVVPH